MLCNYFEAIGTVLLIPVIDIPFNRCLHPCSPSLRRSVACKSTSAQLLLDIRCKLWRIAYR